MPKQFGHTTWNLVPLVPSVPPSSNPRPLLEIATMGARDFSCAISGFSEVHISVPHIFCETSPLVHSAFSRKSIPAVHKKK